MRHIYTTDRQQGRGSARLLARVQRQRLVGMLFGLLLLPVGVMAQEAYNFITIDTPTPTGSARFHDFGGHKRKG